MLFESRLYYTSNMLYLLENVLIGYKVYALSKVKVSLTHELTEQSASRSETKHGRVETPVFAQFNSLSQR